MDRIEKMKEAGKEYRRKVKAGEIKVLNPVEKALANPRSLRAAITGKCWDCCCGQRKEVTLCPSKDCPLWNQRPWQPKDRA